MKELLGIKFKACGKVYSFIIGVGILSELNEDTKRKYVDNYKFLHGISGETEWIN